LASDLHLAIKESGNVHPGITIQKSTGFPDPQAPGRISELNRKESAGDLHPLKRMTALNHYVVTFIASASDRFKSLDSG